MVCKISKKLKLGVGILLILTSTTLIKFPFNDSITESLDFYGWTGQDDPVRGLNMRHIKFHPNRYTSDAIHLIENDEFDVKYKKLAIYITSNQSIANFEKTLLTILNLNCTIDEKRIYWKWLSIQEEISRRI